MSDFTDDLDDEDDEPSQPQHQQRRTPTEAEIRIWRKQAKKWEQAEPELTKLQRENLVLRTPGLNSLSDRQMRALFATHDGDLTPDALRSTAEDLGFVAAAPPDVPADEMAAHERIANASAGGRSVPGGGDVAPEQFAGMSQQEVIAWAAAQGKLEVQ